MRAVTAEDPLWGLKLISPCLHGLRLISSRDIEYAIGGSAYTTAQTTLRRSIVQTLPVVFCACLTMFR